MVTTWKRPLASGSESTHGSTPVSSQAETDRASIEARGSWGRPRASCPMGACVPEGRSTLVATRRASSAVTSG